MCEIISRILVDQHHHHMKMESLVQQYNQIFSTKVGAEVNKPPPLFKKYWISRGFKIQKLRDLFAMEPFSNFFGFDASSLTVSLKPSHLSIRGFFKDTTNDVPPSRPSAAVPPSSSSASSSSSSSSSNQTKSV